MTNQTYTIGDIEVTLNQDASLHHQGEYRAPATGDDGQDYVVIWETTPAWDAGHKPGSTMSCAHSKAALEERQSAWEGGTFV
jgi:hypothetical protein